MQRLNLKKFAASIALGLLTALAVTVVQATPLLLIADPITETPSPYWQISSLDDLKVGLAVPRLTGGKATLLVSRDFVHTSQLKQLAEEHHLQLVEMTPQWFARHLRLRIPEQKIPSLLLLLDSDGHIRLRQEGWWTEEQLLLLRELVE